MLFIHDMSLKAKTIEKRPLSNFRKFKVTNILFRFGLDLEKNLPFFVTIFISTRFTSIFSLKIGPDHLE